MNTKEKALALSYVLTKLLQQNLDVVLLEMRESKDTDAGKMQHRLEKLRGASNNTFAVLERNIGSDLDALTEDIELILEDLWNQ